MKRTVFCFREFGLPVSTVFFHNGDRMRETGEFLAIGDDGAIANTLAGALMKHPAHKAGLPGKE